MTEAAARRIDACRLLGVSLTTFEYWREIPALAFPEPVDSNEGPVYDVAELRSWQQRHVHDLDRIADPCPTPPIVEYAELVDALRRRRRHLGLTGIEVDEIAGFSEGYTGKLECHVRGGPGRAFGSVSLPLWLRALGVGLVVVEINREAA